MATRKFKTHRSSGSLKSKKSSGKKDKKKFILVLGFLFIAILLAELFVLGTPKDDGPFAVQVVGRFNGTDQPCGTFNAWDLVRADSDHFVVSDQNGKRMLIFDIKGKFLKAVTEKEAGAPPFKEISNMSSDLQGHFYVMDAWNSLIRGFDLKGDPIIQVSVPQSYGPRGVAWNNGTFLVADTGDHKVVKVGTDGSLEATWGHRGSEKGAFSNPVALTVDLQGNVYVADQDNHRVECLDAQGKFIREYKVGAVVANVALDSQGRVYASSTEGGFVKIFDKNGKGLGKLTEAGKTEPIHGLKGIVTTENGDLIASRNDEILILHPLTAGQQK